MYPYVEQLLRWKADDEAQKVGGLVLEVKGDFCVQVKSILARANRPDDYIEIGLDTGVCYNPLHNELDPYAVAYAVATLLNNLFGRSKEPFWQQAYGGASVADVKRLREPEVENAKLKRMYADLALENSAIKDVLNRKL